MNSSAVGHDFGFEVLDLEGGPRDPAFGTPLAEVRSRRGRARHSGTVHRRRSRPDRGRRDGYHRVRGRDRRERRNPPRRRPALAACAPLQPVRLPAAGRGRPRLPLVVRRFVGPGPLPARGARCVGRRSRPDVAAARVPRCAAGPGGLDRDRCGRSRPSCSEGCRGSSSRARCRACPSSASASTPARRIRRSSPTRPPGPTRSVTCRACFRRSGGSDCSSSWRRRSRGRAIRADGCWRRPLRWRFRSSLSSRTTLSLRGWSGSRLALPAVPSSPARASSSRWDSSSRCSSPVRTPERRSRSWQVAWSGDRRPPPSSSSCGRCSTIRWRGSRSGCRDASASSTAMAARSSWTRRRRGRRGVRSVTARVRPSPSSTSPSSARIRSSSARWAPPHC